MNHRIMKDNVHTCKGTCKCTCTCTNHAFMIWGQC